MAIYSRMQMPDGCQDWIDCLRNGDEHALQHFYEKYHRGIYAFCLGIVQHEGDAADLAEESYIKLWGARASLNDETHLRNSLYLYARQLSLICLKRRRRDNRVEEAYNYLSVVTEDSQGAAGGPDAAMAESRIFEMLLEEIESLPPGCREIFKLFYFEEKTTKQIAEQLKIATQTVLNQKTRARNRLKALFQKKEIYSLLFLLLTFTGS